MKLDQTILDFAQRKLECCVKDARIKKYAVSPNRCHAIYGQRIANILVGVNPELMFVEKWYIPVSNRGLRCHPFDLIVCNRPVRDFDVTMDAAKYLLMNYQQISVIQFGMQGNAFRDLGKSDVLSQTLYNIGRNLRNYF